MIISYLEGDALINCSFMCKINLEVIKKVVPLHSRLRNGHKQVH